MTTAAHIKPAVVTSADGVAGHSVNRRVFSAAVIIAALTTLAKGTSTIKELLVARTFGTSDALDAFLIAILLPTFAINVVAGSFNTALIPVFIRVRDQTNPSAAQRLLSNVTAFGLVLLLAVALVLWGSSEFILPLLGSSFTPQKLALAKALFPLILPTLALSGLATTWSGVLNAQGRFAIPAATAAITPLVLLVSLWSAADRIGVYSLAFGTIFGSVLEVTALGLALKANGFQLRPSWDGFTEPVRDVLKQYAPMAGGAMLLCSTTLVDQAMAAMLGPGQVSALAYGNRVVGLVLSIASMAIGTAVFPHFSSMVAARNWSGIRHTLRTYTALILAVSLVAMALLLIFSEPLISFLYERRSFTRQDTLLVSAIQRAYTLQIPFYLIGTLFVRLISSLRANQILLYGAVISLILDVLLNFVFIAQFGAPGIGLSTTVVYLVSTLFLGLMVGRLLLQAEARHG